MKKVLIADNSHIFATTLAKSLETDFQVRYCTDGRQALLELDAFQPDIFIVNFMLPYVDGVTVLQHSAFQPSVLIALTSFLSDSVTRWVRDLGIDYTLICPSVRAVKQRLLDLLAQEQPVPKLPDLQEVTAYHLKTLQFSPHRVGYRQLCLAIPLFAENPQQLLSKELYPRVAQLWGAGDARTVEHSIRNAIEDAYRHRDSAVWRRYFSGTENGFRSCPSNKAFLCRMAEIIHTP